MFGSYNYQRIWKVNIVMWKKNQYNRSWVLKGVSLMLICRTVKTNRCISQILAWKQLMGKKTSTEEIIFSSMQIIKMSRSGVQTPTGVGRSVELIPIKFQLISKRDVWGTDSNLQFLSADCRAHQHRLHWLLGAVRHGEPLVCSPRQQHHPARSQPPAVHVCKELHRVQSHDLLHLQPELQKGG